jgi:N12 class adenine-specific DNA methylase
MATKLQLITAMYEHELHQMTAQPGEWQRFLLAAGRNYRLSFEEQVQVFVQRPDAIAVLELEKWNKTFNRWVNKGATGIAVVDRDSLDKRRLKYYFDISDTHDSRYSRPVPIWEVKSEYHADVIETLEATFGDLEDKESLAHAIISAAHNAVADNMTDYLSDLMDCREDSFLEELDDLNVEVFLKEALQTSVAYLWLARCGIDPADYFEPEDFQHIFEFNTPDTLMVLGTAASDIAETGLREISSTVLALQKSERSANRTLADSPGISDNSNVSTRERRNDYDTGNTAPDLHRGERVSDSRPAPAGRTRSRAWQVRLDAPPLSDEPPQIPVQPPADERWAEPAPAGNRAERDGAAGNAVEADGESRGRDRGLESQRHDGVDSADDQHPQPGGGNDTERPDLQLEDFPSPEEQQQTIEEAEGTAATPTPSAFSMPIPIEALDEELTRHSGALSPKLRIYHHFEQLGTEDEHVKFLKNHYGQGGHSPFGDGDYWIDNSAKGMTFTKGDLSNPDLTYTVPWNKVTKRIQELITADRFLSAQDKEVFYPHYLEYLEHLNEIRQKNAALDAALALPIAERRATLAPRLVDFLNGLNENARYLNAKLTDNGLEEIADTASVAQIEAILSDPQQAQKLTKAMKEISGASSGVFERNHGYRFHEELAALYERRPVYHLGDTVFIGTHEYEVLAFDENTVRLYDAECPIINAEFPRTEFDRRVAENPANEHLLSAVAEQTEQTAPEIDPTEPADPRRGLSLSELIKGDLMERGYAVSEEIIQEGIDNYGSRGDFQDIADYIENEYLTDEEALEDELGSEGLEEEPYTPVPGDRYEIQGRQFAVDSVSEETQSVSLQDVTFQQNAGFPIFRRESLDFIRQYEPLQEAPAVTPAPLSEATVVSREVHPTSLFDIEIVKLRFPQEGEPEPTEQAITPAWEQKKKPARVNYFDAFPDTPMSQRHNFRITDDNLGVGGAKAKFRANMDAIHLLHDLELDRRLATRSEQETLSRYVGWGSLADAFKEKNPGWENEFLELQTALSAEEYESARATTLNAHYTSPVVIKAIYKAVENMGFTTGNILDPGCGVGNFQGLLPDSMSDSKVYGIEIDPITGRIAQQLYPKNSIAIQGYEKTALPDSFFDLAIGNVPFGGYGVSDKKYDKHKFHIHDYFFAKTLDKVRPGGVIAFVTSSWTMDKQNPAVRKYIAQRAELLGAIRLPNNAFKANAGTEVTTDILFLQKRDRMVDIEPDWVHLGRIENDENPDANVTVNQYFIDHPDMILGTMSNESGTRMYGNMNSVSCVPFEGRELSDLLDEAIQNIHAEITDYERDEDEQETDDSIPADPSVRNFSFAVVDSKLYFRENSRMKLCELPATTVSRIKGLIDIRDCVRMLIEYQTEDYSDTDIKAEQSKLNRLYDSFTKKYGLISSRANVSAFGSDSSFPLLGALEMLDEDGNLLRKADMFTKRTIRPKIEITHVDTATEALAVSMGEMAKVDLDYMVGLTGMTEDALTSELEGVIFQDPIRKAWLTAGEYLSGNVREKLETARRIAETDPAFAVNVTALEAVQPADLTAAEIAVRLGATWLPPEIVQNFVFELLETPRYAQWNIKIRYSQHTAEWGIDGKSSDRSNVRAYNTYGTSRANAYKIIEETLNLRDIRIFDYVEDDEGRKKAVLNKKETMLAQAKQEQIKAAFADWIWTDPARRGALVRLYNDKFNSVRPREYDGSHINFVGMNPAIDLREHQVNAVAHIIYGGNTLLAHEVGAGKTYEMVAAAMEMKRLGLCHKSMIVVPNHIIEQFAAEWLQLYPSANILVSTKKDFEPKNRRKFCARIATGDYDAVIIGHSQFEKIPMSVEFQREMLEDQLDDLLMGIREAKENKGDNFTVKQLEKSKKSLQLRLDKLNDQSRKDDLVTFEELGVDRLFVDESHGYKNLFLYTKMRNVGGIAQTEAQKSSDMFMKCRYLDRETDGRGVIFATGTPISNSMVEMYSIQRYLQYNTLRDRGLQHFDAWASTFGETVTAIELSPEGSGYRAKTRFAKFYNLPELMNMFREVADIQTAEMLDLPTPKPNFHTEVIAPSEMQEQMVADLADRAERVRSRMVDSHEDNMLCITNDGRKLALDQRLMNPMLPDYEQGKAAVAAENIFRHWEDGRENRLTQLCFCDLSTPKNDGQRDDPSRAGTAPDSASPPVFTDVYNDIKQKLVARGVPAEEIAFIHDADTEQKKKDLFAKVRTGTVRVLMGSTAKCGAGMNVQDRLIALHDLDVPWRPSDMTQRLGRIKRQGNKNPEIEIYRYVTEKTFDAYSYQLIENKQRFISQVMTGKSPVRSAEDVDEQALSYAEIKALATGNPMIIEKCELEMAVGKLKLLKASHLSQRYDLEDRLLKHYPAQIKGLTERIAGFERDIATAAAHPKAQGDEFVGIVLNGTTYADKKAAGTEILAACQAMTSPEPVPLGSYRGFEMDLSFDTFNKEYRVTMKGALSHTVPLGGDIFGNITRIDNALDAFPAKLDACKEQLTTARAQMENAKAEVERPFPQEAELAENTERLNEVNIALNLDKRENEIVEGEPDEGDGAEQPERKSKDRER